VVMLALVVAAVVQPWTLLPTHLAMTGFVGACALRRDHFLAGLLEIRIVRHVGVVSYGIYLLNVPVVAAFRRLVGDDHAFLLFIASTLASIAIATATYRWVERPFLALRDRFRPSASPEAATAAASEDIRRAA
ncbi:MAG: acyltransferase 3, partial [Labilithrix sp.]|nr:acyltransferase 3 [Labilithrix sp.]